MGNKKLVGKGIIELNDGSQEIYQSYVGFAGALTQDSDRVRYAAFSAEPIEQSKLVKMLEGLK